MHNAETNTEKLDYLNQIMAAVLGEILRKGFFGSANIELDVQDGTIQRIRRTIQKVEGT